MGFDHGVGHPLLLLCGAKVSNYRKNKECNDLGHYSEWPKVADAVIKATECFPLLYPKVAARFAGLAQSSPPLLSPVPAMEGLAVAGASRFPPFPARLMQTHLAEVKSA